MALMAGPMTVLYKFHHNGVKVVITRLLDTYTYFFALDGEVYIDFVLPPDKHQLKSHKTTLNEIEPKLISHLSSKAIENIEYHQKRIKERSWYQPIITFLHDTATRGIDVLQSGFANAAADRRPVDVSRGGPEGSGDEKSNAAGHAPEASGVRAGS